MPSLKAQSLTAAAFAPFGQVIAFDAATAATVPHSSINDGNAVRYDLIPDMQLTAQGGMPMLALFRAEARTFPLNIGEMERHALGSQTFIPLVLQSAANDVGVEYGDLHLQTPFLENWAACESTLQRINFFRLPGGFRWMPA